MLIEVCANSLQSALNAKEAGADRIELCSELGVGGITPSYGLIKMVKTQVEIAIHVLIRPRSGHFTYSETEFEVMLADIDFCKEMEVEGIVSGILHQNHTLDLERTKTLVERSAPLQFTFHRAFDWVNHPEQTLKDLKQMGVETVLTSGQFSNAQEGLEQLKKWQDSSTMTIMPGGGIHPENALAFKKAGLRAIHLSGTSFVNNILIDQKISMNSNKHLSEHHIAVTNTEIIRQTVRAVH